MGLRKLKTDEEFKHLIRPLLRKEYLQLEQNLLADGCRDPIVVWHDVIVDGHRVNLEVNHPYSVSLAETVYLTGIDKKYGDSCVLQIVYEPCRYVTLSGIVMMLIGAMLLFINGPRKRKEVLS